MVVVREEGVVMVKGGMVGWMGAEVRKVSLIKQVMREDLPTPGRGLADGRGKGEEKGREGVGSGRRNGN